MGHMPDRGNTTFCVFGLSWDRDGLKKSFRSHAPCRRHQYPGSGETRSKKKMSSEPQQRSQKILFPPVFDLPTWGGGGCPPPGPGPNPRDPTHIPRQKWPVAPKKLPTYRAPRAHHAPNWAQCVRIHATIEFGCPAFRMKRPPRVGKSKFWRVWPASGLGRL